jgi:hypothetical protein
MCKSSILAYFLPQDGEGEVFETAVYVCVCALVC